MYFDPIYLIFMLPAFAFSLWAGWRTKSAFKKYSRVRAASGLTGAQAAARMLAHAGITDVEIVRAGQGSLSDHYHPGNEKHGKRLALSDAVYDQPSIAAIGVACHEAGHAIQDAEGYKPLGLRTALVPTAGIGSKLGYYMMLGGLFLSYMGGPGSTVIYLGAILFSAVLLFQIVTLPVEFDATARAKRLAFEQGMILDAERVGVNRVLNAAAMTYVAAAAGTLMTLFYFLIRARD